MGRRRAQLIALLFKSADLLQEPSVLALTRQNNRYGFERGISRADPAMRCNHHPPGSGLADTPSGWIPDGPALRELKRKQLFAPVYLHLPGDEYLVLNAGLGG